MQREEVIQGHVVVAVRIVDHDQVRDVVAVPHGQDGGARVGV